MNSQRFLRSASNSPSRILTCTLITLGLIATKPTLANDSHHGGQIRADDHAPIGVMGDHMHKQGEWMASYRFMHMDMEGNRIGDREVSPEEIVTTVPNRFFGQVPPPIGAAQNLRVVPTQMTMQMHMLGLMYAPSNSITLMGMLNIVEKEMDHITFLGLDGTNVKGTFTTRSEGIGDTTLGALIRVYEQGNTDIHLNAGISLPTGSIRERDNALRPVPNEPKVDQRLPYSMQLGTGTYDLLPGITYMSRAGDLSWGAQYKARIHLGENDEDYTWGDKHTVTGWLAYQFAPWVSASFRGSYQTQQSIDGIDDEIVAPIQTANPDFFGGDKLELYGGVNLVGQSDWLRGHRLAIEAGAPVYQDLNGPQMETDWTLTVGWQKAF